MRLPPPEEGEARPEIDLDGVVLDPQVGGGDVADLIAVVDVSSGCRQHRAERPAQGLQYIVHILYLMVKRNTMK